MCDWKLGHFVSGNAPRRTCGLFFLCNFETLLLVLLVCLSLAQNRAVEASPAATAPQHLGGLRATLRTAVDGCVPLALLYLCFFHDDEYVHVHYTLSAARNLFAADFSECFASNRLVVSLGTVTGRENQLVQTVESILRQSVLPKRILVHYSGGYYPVNEPN
jgi:hypothetical protein